MTHSTTIPAVSVVMATYDGDDLNHLRASVDSILQQTFRDFEYVIVVDGPVQGAKREYLEGIPDERVRSIWLSENVGPAKARNAGIATARGEFLVIQDADDLSDSMRIEKQMRLLSERGWDVIGSSVNQIDADGKLIKQKPYPTDEQKIAALMPFVNSINNSAVLCRTNVLKTLPYPEHMRFGEDYQTWVRALKRGMHLGNHPEFLVSYRLASARRRGWKIAKADIQIKLSALPIAKWYKWPIVTAAALATGVVRMVPEWAVKHVYRIKESVLPKLAKYETR